MQICKIYPHVTYCQTGKPGSKTSRLCSFKNENMFSNIKILLQASYKKNHFIDNMHLVIFSKFEIPKSKIENFVIGRIILNNFYF